MRERKQWQLALAEIKNKNNCLCVGYVALVKANEGKQKSYKNYGNEPVLYN